jgi:hypothetical protein
LDDASGNLIALGLPPRRTPARADLTVTATGGRSETYTIDNDTYWDAVLTATNGYAVEHTFIVPNLRIYLPIVIHSR